VIAPPNPHFAERVRDSFARQAAMRLIGATINMLAPATGERLEARGTVVKSGRTLSIARADVFGVANGEERLVATMQQTLMVMHGMADEARV